MWLKSDEGNNGTDGCERISPWPRTIQLNQCAGESPPAVATGLTMAGYFGTMMHDGAWRSGGNHG